MGSVTAQAIFTRVSRVLLDVDYTRWTLPELLDWLNDGIREVILQKPSAYSTTTTIMLDEGTLQAVPAASLGLLRVIRNLIPPQAGQTAPVGGRVIRMVSREVLDTQSPDWHDPTITREKDVVKHVVFDEANPYAFYVYPPNTGKGMIEVILANEPAPMAVIDGDDTTDIASYSDLTIPIPDIYVNALVDYVLYRAYIKDASFAGNTQRAALHYQQFANSLGLKVKLDASLSPNTAAQTENTAAVGMAAQGG